MTPFTDPAEAGKLVCGPAWLAPTVEASGVCYCPACIALAQQDEAYAPDEPPW